MKSTQVGINLNERDWYKKLIASKEKRPPRTDSFRATRQLERMIPGIADWNRSRAGFSARGS